MLEPVIDELVSKYSLKELYDGLIALDLLKSLRPDIIFLDHNMPILNGEETLKRIRLNDTLTSIPVYLLSTHIGPHDCDQMNRLGATGYLEKPSSFSEFCAALNHIIRKHITGSVAGAI